jgi:hypothetical protein
MGEISVRMSTLGLSRLIRKGAVSSGHNPGAETAIRKIKIRQIFFARITYLTLLFGAMDFAGIFPLSSVGRKQIICHLFLRH